MKLWNGISFEEKMIIAGVCGILAGVVLVYGALFVLVVCGMIAVLGG